MNWEAIGVVAEVVGAVAVVFSLIYLAVQVRHAKDATESASVDALAAGFNTLNTHFVDDPELCALYLRAMENPGNLDDVERFRFIALMQSYINHFNTLKKYHDAELLPEDEWAAHSQSLRYLMSTPGGHWLCEHITITPSVLAELRKPPEFAFKDGFLGISSHK